MNHNDYEFLELHPYYDIENYTVPHRTFCNLEWSDLKDRIINMDDKTVLSDPEFVKVMQSSFFDKVSNPTYSILKNILTDEYIFPMTPFRGNESYSRKKRKRMKPIHDAFGKKDLSRPVKGMRSSEVRLVNGLMITFSYAREYSEEEFTGQGFPVIRWSPWDAWKSITPLINQFKVELNRIISALPGNKGKHLDYGSCLVKEGCADMYPAPHLIMLFNEPLIAHRYGKQWLLGDRKDDRSLVNSIQAIWERIAGSHCKINAIASTGGFVYAFKYVTKSIDLDIKDFDNMTKEQAVCLNTHLNQSLHNQRDMIGKSFLEKLDYVREQTLLDITRNELKQIKKMLNELGDEIERKGGFNVFTFFENPELNRYWNVLKEYERLRDEAYRIKLNTSPWIYLSGGFSAIISAKEHIECTD